MAQIRYWKLNKQTTLVFLFVFFLMTPLSIWGQEYVFNVADQASNYSGTWDAGSNKGTGFDEWFFTIPDTDNAGKYIGNTGAGNSTFGLWSQNQAGALALRSFEKPLLPEHTFEVTIGHTVTINGEVGLTLFAGDNAKITLKFVGGGSQWVLNDGGVDFEIAQAYAANTPLTFVFTYNGGTSYSFSFGGQTATNWTASHDLSGIDRINLFSNNQGDGQNFGFDNLKISGAVSNPADVPLGSDVSISGAVVLGKTQNLTVNDLTISGSGNSLTLESDDTDRASLITLGNVTGNITSTFSLSQAPDWGDGSGGWHMVSSPVASQGISGSWTPTGEDNDYDFYAWEESSGTWLNQKVSENNISVFNVGQGYLVSYQAEGNRVFSGSPTTGNVNIPLELSGAKNKSGWTYEPGWNLIGNPYPSGLEWGSVGETDLEDGFAYIYDNSDKEYKYHETGVILPNQGFFVKADNDANLVFNNTMRSHPVNTKNTEYGLLDVDDIIVLSISNNEMTDKTHIRIIEESSFDRDRRDALKLFGFSESQPHIYSFSHDLRKLAVNSIPTIAESQSISLGIKAPEGEQYTLTLEDIRGLFDHYPLFLYDRVNQLAHNLKEEESFSFAFAGEAHENRFELFFHEPDPTNISNVQEAFAPKAWIKNQVINIETHEDKLHISLFSSLGRLVLQTGLTGAGRHQVPVSLAPGVYVLKTRGERQVYTQKLIIY